MIELFKKRRETTNKQNDEFMKILKDKKTKSEEQRLKEDTEAMRRHYGMLLDHHIIDFDMFENKVGKENVPKILQEYNKILLKCELAEYEPDFIGICRHDKVDCALQEPCLLGFKCNHEHYHSNAKMCYLNKKGGELETFLLKNNTSVPKLLEMEKTIVIELPKIHGKEIPYLAETDAFVLKTETNGTESIKGVTLSEKLAKKMISDNDFYGVSSYEQVNVYTEELETTQSQPFNGDEFTKIIAEQAQKTAQVNHEFNMKEIKAKLIADLCKELVKTPIHHEDVPQRAREIADKALENL